MGPYSLVCFTASLLTFSHVEEFKRTQDLLPNKPKGPSHKR